MSEVEKGWTPEPWQVASGTAIYETKKAHRITDTSHSMQISRRNGQWEERMFRAEEEANAARIVACINGCVDIPKPEGLGDLVKAIQGAFGSDEAVGQLFTERLERVTAALRACGIEVE